MVQNNSKTPGIDFEKIAVAGDSSGENLAAVLCFKARDHNVKMPALQVLLYPFVSVLDAAESMREYTEGHTLSLHTDMWYFLVMS